MSALDRGLRRELAKAVRAARKTAEAGARNALTALTVAAAEPDSSLSAEERALRRRLRAHGRQLGDLRQGAEQEVGRLAHEVAYEHWHRMLFARFLAENGLLVEPTHEVPVSLDECRDIARESRRDIWAVAAEFAAAMLPRIFRPDDPSLAVRLPPETQRELERTLAGLPPAVFLADDALGWTYQFWQTDRKDEVNRSGVKIGADELPAVTQLFTEPYMVRFLFHNTVGAWRAGRLLADRPELTESAESENDLRRAVRLKAVGGYDFDYLRFVREPGNGTDGGGASGPWRPAAGSFDKWPARAAELRILDPCCGSGHFLVEGLHLVVRLRMEEESLSLRDAIGAVLRDNLHGLEIDPRCAQVAAFSVAFAAWKLAGRAIELPPLRIACSGLAPNATREQWLALAERAAGFAGSAPARGLHGTRQTLASSALRHTFESLHCRFADAPTLGSLIDPRQANKSMFTEHFDRIRPLLDSVLAESETDTEHKERVVAASGIAEASSLLAGTYALIVTNVPYLARQKQGAALRLIGRIRFPASKGDLATMFVERGLDWAGSTGVTAFVVPQNWFFLKTYQNLRRTLLTEHRWRLLARLGTGAFETIGGHVVNVALTVVSAETPDNAWRMTGLDVSAPRHRTRIFSAEKAVRLRDSGDIHCALQADQLRNPDFVVLHRPSGQRNLLRDHTDAHTGISTTDYICFGRKLWEFPYLGAGWRFQQSTVDRSTDFGGREHVLRWDRDGDAFSAVRTYVCRGGMAWKKSGIAVSRMGPLSVTRYTGELFDDNTSAIGPLDEDLLPAVWCYCRSPRYAESVREIDQSLKATNATLVKVPFDLEHWQRVAAERYPNGLPAPYSDDPTQWVFHGHPCGSAIWNSEERRTGEGPIRVDYTVLQVAVARLLGYRWPAERDPRMPLAEEQRAWVERCAELERFTDEDGVVCLPAVRGEEPAADRLRQLLVAAYGSEWSPTIELRLLRAACSDGRPAENLDDWLRHRFFAEHCRLFHHRPFVWHIWDGLTDGFHALVNYHRLAAPEKKGRGTLEALIFGYLGAWIDRQRGAQREGAAGAEARLAAALELRRQLELILEGEPPLDLFIRWKPLRRQPLGWEPDLDDGVRLNIRPFMRAKLRKGGRKGAGLLRAKPNIHWKKDRGREPQRLRARSKQEPGSDSRPRADFPWFWTCPGAGTEDDRTDFMGGGAFEDARWNDLHYTLAAKRAARERHKRESAEKRSDDTQPGDIGA